MPDGSILPARPVNIDEPAENDEVESDPPAHGVPVDAYGDPAGPISVVPPSAAPFVPGAHKSDHVSVSTAPQAQAPAVQSDHEEMLRQPASIPVNTSNKSNTQRQRPAAVVADPSNIGHAAPGTVIGHTDPLPIVAGDAGDAGNTAPANIVEDDPGNASEPAKPGKMKPAKGTWDTNHPKNRPVPVTTTHNIGNATPPAQAQDAVEEDPSDQAGVADPKAADPGHGAEHHGGHGGGGNHGSSAPAGSKGGKSGGKSK
jgi:hypothetical protein